MSQIQNCCIPHVVPIDVTDIVHLGVPHADVDLPDMQQAVARHDANKPLMLDADGQGSILTNATFAANIDQYGTMKNFTKTKISALNTTSSVYVMPKNDGVFLNLVQNGNGTSLLV